MTQNSTEKLVINSTTFEATASTTYSSNQTFDIEHGHINSFDDYPKKWDHRGWH